MTLAHLGKAYGSSVVLSKVGKYTLKHIELSLKLLILTKIYDQIIAIVKLKRRNIGRIYSAYIAVKPLEEQHFHNVRQIIFLGCLRNTQLQLLTYAGREGLYACYADMTLGTLGIGLGKDLALSVENEKDREALCGAVHEVTKSWT